MTDDGSKDGTLRKKVGRKYICGDIFFHQLAVKIADGIFFAHNYFFHQLAVKIVDDLFFGLSPIFFHQIAVQNRAILKNSGRYISIVENTGEYIFML